MANMGGDVPKRQALGVGLEALRRASTAACFAIAISVGVANGQAPGPASQQPAPSAAAIEFHIAVVDENGAAVASAQITLTPAAGTPIQSETDYAGRKEFSAVTPGVYTLRVAKEGFFAVTQTGIQVGEVASADITLHHTREFPEQVNVVYSPPAIDPAKTQSSENFTSEEIINLPFPIDRDIRYTLPFLPGVLQDATGQLHVNGSSTRMVFDQIDGFNVSDPSSGLFPTRVSVDSLRSVDVAGSRYSTEYGKGSGGVISLRTATGDDHWRLTGTDFIPGLTGKRGLTVNNWTPRLMTSGPIRKGKAWFMDALDGELDQSIYTELPVGADRNSVWRGSDLAKFQMNLAQNNNLTLSLLLNSQFSPRNGLDPQDPVSTTQRYTANTYIFNARDQHLFQSGLLLEAGIALSAYDSNLIPMGSQMYVMTPNGSTGNYYFSNRGRGGRTEVIGNLFVPPLHGGGKHEIKMGVDIDRVSDFQNIDRHSFEVVRSDGTLSRSVSFVNAPPFTRNNMETSGYAQDRWTPTSRILIEPGIRFDTDEIVRGVAPSPRIASTLMLNKAGSSKLSAGIGTYRDASNLSILTTSLGGTRTDLFYDATGTTLLQPPVVTTFSIGPQPLLFSDATNASLAFEQALPKTTYLRVELLDRRTRDIWTFVNPGASTLPDGPFSGDFILNNSRTDHYDSATVTVRHVFRQNHAIYAAYTRARALTNADFGYSLDSVFFSPQAGGPLPWDAPDRLLSWGYLPFVHKFDFGYTLDWRTGYPFSVQNDSAEVVGAPYSYRFPSYFSLDMSLERRLTLFHYQWAVRGGVTNVTRHGNYSSVNSNVDSTDFLSYQGAQGRSFILRIRLLGRK
jgi:hypothetical protein